MNTPALWPFPGVLWGRYPQRCLPLAPGQRSGRMRPARLERQARALVDKLPGNCEDRTWAALGRCRAALEDALGVQPRWQQVMAAFALLQEHLVEMDTGEGKTFAIALAAATAALAGSPVHVVTANDYLAQRDAAALAGYYGRLGLRCGWVTEAMDEAGKREAYAANVTYVTGKELAFDYLRDAAHVSPAGTALQQRVAGAPAALILRGLCFAILDEADTLLIDEARVPLVLAQRRTDPAQRAFLLAAWELSARLREGRHFRLSADGAIVRLLPAARDLLAGWPVGDHPLHAHPAHQEQALQLALSARHVLRRDRDYLVRGDRVDLIDAASGRHARGRAWSRGLHQLVELKEGVAATDANETVAQITYQRFFPRYHRLAGISGTLHEARSEVSRVYNLRLVRVPAHRPRIVRREPSRLFASRAQLWDAVAHRATVLAGRGRPVLVGVGSVEDSQALSAVLDRCGVAHQVLSARHDDQEQEVLQRAGRAGCVTVATSMAGRGSDIELDLVALAAGGLHVVLCQLNASARIDRQFLGRTGRQGQPGTTEHWVAADFDVLAHRWPQAWLRWIANSASSGPAVDMLLRLTQAARAYTEMQQRVSVWRSAEAQERDFGFSRDQLI